ncbi:MAG: exodeoxyribonuclease V subunit gamma [Candidatus Competibacteraceae bacterium]|nr:exodeoxyribonuclease V subunit gamma [Candidatus Competibacteraceae bacterium]
MLHTYRSNRLEVLAARLTDVLCQPLRQPLAQDLVVVQSNGMARWLALRLADALGVCANVGWRFPATFLWDMSRAILTHLPRASSFDKPALVWRTMALLRDLEQSPRFEPLHAWLGEDRSDFRRHELAQHIADSFDQYLVYRPDWIRQWEAGEGEHWQAELWRRLALNRDDHRARVQDWVRAALDSGAFDRRALPERVAIVGVAALPPTYLDLLAALARYLEIHLFLLDPCQEYWGDIQAERDLARLGEDIDADEAYLTVGNPLLASLGKQGRDFLDLLQAYPRAEWERFVEPAGDELLQRLQADILHLRERGGEDCPPLPLDPGDRSVQVHVCHGPMREVEVLHDQLLALFERWPQLLPSDVIVMAPDIAVYGPLIEAVFDSAPRERRIPFSVADQNVRVENPLVEVFFKLLDSGGGRFDAAQVMSLLEPPAVRRRFDVSEGDLERIRRWVRGAGIRWGIDAEIKRTWDLPATGEHTWRAGLDRLLLGYALPGGGQDLYGDLLPYDEVEGGDALALGCLYRFAETLFELDERVRQARPWAEWTTALEQVLNDFFEAREREENELQVIRAALKALEEHAGLADFDEPVSLGVVKSALRLQLNTVEGQSGRFLGGGVTCCAMVPMRSIPFAVVCLIGMNDDAYPRPRRPVGFDLMAARFRRGDRSRRQDDRYLFLETLLSARRCLYLSYVGQSIRDNSVLPPSVLLSELLDAVDRGFYRPEGGRASERLMTRHPLQAFSRRYFDGRSALFSYAREWIEASRQAGRGEREASPLLSGELPEPEPGMRTVTLETLARFFKNPARWLLRERLGIRPEEREDVLATREPFVLDGLENYQLVGQMLALHQNGKAASEIRKVMRASGSLPHGQVGDCVFASAQERVARFAGRLGRALPRRGTEWLNVDLTLGEFRLVDRLTGLTPAGWVGYRLASMKADDHLRLWLYHLALNATAPAGVPWQSQWVAEDKEVVLPPLPDARERLRLLLELYWQGSRRLLPFFPRSALAYVERLRKEQDADKALWAARKVWDGDDFGQSRPERDDPFYRLAFRDTDPLDAEFTALASAIFEPLLASADRVAESE